MKKYSYISLNKFRYYHLSILVLAVFLIFSSVEVSSQGFYRKRSERNKNNGTVKNNQGKVEHPRNILWLEGLGSNQVVGVKYERILMFGAFFSVRFDLGVTPFVLDEKYNFIAGRSITPMIGMGFYFHIQPFPVRIGVGCTVLHDIYFDRIPETITDTLNGGKVYAPLTYKARVMPFAIVEATIKERWCIRAGYTPIIDPPNEAQTDIYMTHWATIGFGYKFGR